MSNETIPYGFIYITTNKINGKKYIGQKRYDMKSRWHSYLGSGFWLRKDIDKYGKENFYREIIDEGYSEEEMNIKEKYWIDFYNAVDSPDFYNKIEGGNVQESLSRKQSIPVICIDNNYIFRSIQDALIWSGYGLKYLKTSFNLVHSFDKKEKLIFRPLSDLAFRTEKTKLCCVCAVQFTYKDVKVKYCDECRELARKYQLKINHDFKKSNSKSIKIYKINDDWVKDYLKLKGRKRIKKRKYFLKGRLNEKK